MGRHDEYVHRRRRILLWLGILSFASSATLVRGQSGFLNIDCGKAQGFTYNDTLTGLSYTSDHDYISTGEIHKVSSTYQGQPGYFTQSYDLRSFPYGTRNCYTLPVNPGSKYLLRASFMYGNYDGKDQLPQFALHAGVNYWYSVTVTNASVNLYQDFIFMGGPGGSLSLCLVNTGGGTPFISALELRPMLDEVYPQANASQALMLVGRTNVGARLLVRYPDDMYDRIWAAYSPDGWTRINTTLPVLTVPSYETPSYVLQTAVYPTTGRTLNFSYSLPSADPAAGSPRIHVFLHFAELQQLKANDSRAFDITLNDKPWSVTVKPTYLQGLTIHTINPETVNTLNYVLVQTASSTLPPIINAAEVYLVRDMTGVETAKQDVDAILAIKAAYKVQKNWEGDPCSPRSFMWEGVNCSSDGSKSPRITTLNLTSSGLTGAIPAAIGNLTQLQTLDLSRNSLTGAIPGFLANLTQLKFLDLSGNSLDGPTPQSLLDRSTAGSLTLKVGSSPNSCSDSGSCETKKKSTSKVGAAVGAAVGAILVSALIIIGVIVWRKKKQQGKVDTAASAGGRKGRGSSFKMASLRLDNKQFAYADLEKITNNFQKEIGRGGFGPVYFGVLENGAEVAVKLLSKSSSQGPQEFQNEALLLTRIHHRNLVSFIGYCSDNINNLALVYEYMAEGSLYDHLQGRSSKFNPLSWTTRLHIAIEAAQGLEYLHHGCKPSIVHRDVKTNNILLNKNFEAKIADFGLSKMFENEAYTHVSTRVMGTPGYLDPEYYVTTKLTEKSDVYSFGIVLLELITGLPAIITTKDKINLSHWVRQRLEEGNITDIVDKRIQDEYDINSIWKAVETALACTPHVSNQRPNMSEVVILLKDCLELETKKEKHQTTRQTNTDSNSNKSTELLALDMSIISNPSAR